MAKIKTTVGRTETERMVTYAIEGQEYQEIRVKISCDGIATPSEIKLISEVVNETAEIVKRIVEEW